MVTHRHFNGLKTTLLFGVLWAALLGIGALVGGGRYILWFAGFGVLTTAYSYWNSDKIAIRAMRAQPVSEVEQPAMFRIVRELTTPLGVPMPALYVSPTAAPNAFATGRSPKHAAVCCTEGILDLLSERELRGVLGHELMHVYNRDILTASVAAAAAGIITSLAQFFMFFGGGRGSRDRDTGPLGALASVLVVILAPIAATLIRLAISRTREYDADEDGAKLTGDPLALASALTKLERGIDARPLAPDPDLEDVSHMMIANPFRTGGAISRLFATHPPTPDRVDRLRAMGHGWES
ncbi:MAG: zinc metalloprotease HtpX [Bifidobacteriaceae bacterium]|jgi:heat shock protein HtpX|nr:zinc metalloprotease HtpX [Bifidobacteriaceae bacterium]